MSCKLFLTAIVLAAIVTLMASTPLVGQTTTEDSAGQASWRQAGQRQTGQGGIRTASRPARDFRSESAPADQLTPSTTRPTVGDGKLPNTHGQVWREYDISPYTLRVTNTKRPEQAVIDWVLRETGYEVWHGEPLGVLSATGRTLRVYHTPEMQAVVADIVDRFVAEETETGRFSLRVVTVRHPNWRVRVQRLLSPVAVQTPGAGAWLLEKENAAMLISELRRRSDFHEHGTSRLTVANGQSSVVSSIRGRSYLREVMLRPDVWPGYEVDLGQIDEGFSIEFGPLLSADGRTIDATIKAEINQVEKLVPVVLDVPTPVAPGQRAKIEVPQMAHFRFHERFRWPVGKVLLVELGLVPLPHPAGEKSLVPGLKLPIGNGPPRASLLVFIQSKASPSQSVRDARAPRRDDARGKLY